MTTKKRRNAQDAWKERAKAIREKMAEIEASMADTEGRDFDWGDVGDMAYVDECVGLATSFIRGEDDATAKV